MFISEKLVKYIYTKKYNAVIKKSVKNQLSMTDLKDFKNNARFQKKKVQSSMYKPTTIIYIGKNKLCIFAYIHQKSLEIRNKYQSLPTSE